MSLLAPYILYPAAGGGGSGFIGATSYGETSGTIGASFDIDVSGISIASGDLIIVTMQADGPYYQDGPSGFTAAFTPNSLNSLGEGCWYLDSATGSETTLSLTNNTGTPDNCAANVAVFRGYSWGSISTRGVTGAEPYNLLSAHTGFASGDIALGGVVLDDDIRTWNAPTGYTISSQISNGTAELGGSSALAYKEKSDTASENPSWTTTTSDANDRAAVWVARLVAD